MDAADAKKSGEPEGGAGGALGESKSTHPTIAAALGFGINKLSPSKDGRRYPCSVCSSTFTRVDNMRAHMLKFHGIEVAPSSTGNSRRSTPVSMVASHYDAGVSGIYDPPSMVPRNLGNLSPSQQPSPIVIQPDGSEDSKVKINSSINKFKSVADPGNPRRKLGGLGNANRRGGRQFFYVAKFIDRTC